MEGSEPQRSLWRGPKWTSGTFGTTRPMPLSRAESFDARDVNLRSATPITPRWDLPSVTHDSMLMEANRACHV